MENKLKCKTCGVILTSVIAANLMANNMFVCDLCRKKNEENPDFHEIIHLATPIENVMVNVSGTASVVTLNATSDGIYVVIPKKYL